MKCKNCGCKIMKRNGKYIHTLTPTGRSNGATSHYLDYGCRCNNPEPSEERCTHCGARKKDHIDYFDTGKKNVCPRRKSMKYRPSFKSPKRNSK